MWNKTIIIVLVVLCITTGALALRANRPPILTYPLEEDQISDLNRFMENIWNMQYGRFELDVVTTTKTKANNGEVWIIYTGPVGYIQFKANDHIYTITPDGW